MKNTAKHTFRSFVSMMLVLCMILSIVPMTALAAEDENPEKPIVYVSIGDSMTNGYCLDGYDGNSGAVNYGIETYSNKFAAWLAGYNGTIANDQVIFTGSKGTVDHRQLAISGMRAQDIQWILELNYDDATRMEEIFNMDFKGTGWNASKWYNDWDYSGDYRTWSDFGDYNFRYADAAARVLSVYHGGNGKGYFTSSYATQDEIEKAIAGVKANPYYPESKQVEEFGGYKYLQIATEFYQDSVADADVISLAVGNTNFGTHMLTEILDVVMSDDKSFANNFSLERAQELAEKDPFVQAKVDDMLNSDAYKQIVAQCTSLVAGETIKDGEISKAERIEYIVDYCMTSYIIGYIGMLNAILELNPDAEIIQIALMNAYEETDGDVAPDTLGALVEIIYGPVNNFLENLPAELIASKTEEEQAKYADAKFYFAEADHVSCMVDVFGDDYYTKDGSYVTYPGILNGTEGYEANTNSIVRDRFAEEIVCGDMIFAALGLKKLNTQDNIHNFLYGGKVYKTDGTVAYEGNGAIAYDMMSQTQKAAYAAQNADAAKEYALYLAFENSLIRSGTENVTMDALANLSNIQAAFLAYYPEVTAAIGNARANYYAAVAPVIVAGSDGALTQDDVLSIMAAYEEVKAGVWKAYEAYHDALKSATGHSTLEHVINCDTCMKKGGHGDGLSEKIVATYNEQMALLPYNIIAKKVEDQTGGLLDGADIKRLCEAADYEAEVYALVAEKSNGVMTSDQVKTLATEDGVWKVADELTGGQYGATSIKTAYEYNIMLSDEQRSQIELLMSVREAVLTLLAKDDKGNFTTKATFVSSAAGIKSAIDNAALLAYLMALPQAMSDALYKDSNMQGALCMNARCLLGTGAGGHPSVGGHQALYDAVMDVYAKVSYEWSEDLTTCTATLNGGSTATATITSEETISATCTTMGTTTYTAVFDVSWAETQTKEVQNIPTIDHVYEAAVTAPTCTEKGYTTYTCVCGDTHTGDEVPATGHKYGDDGKCVCGAVDPDAHPACEYTVAETLTSGNTYILSLGGTKVGSYTFTAVSGGWTIQAADGTYLALADKALTNSTTAFTWTYADGMFKTEVQTTSNNWLSSIFGSFGGFGGLFGSSSSTETYYLVASGSNVSVSTSNANAAATFYTAHSDASHNFNSGVVTAPTCTKDGYTTYTCQRCGYSYTGNTTEATDHNYSETVTEPTCTEKGYTTHTCGSCGDTYVDTEVEALGHTGMDDGICDHCGYDTNKPTEPEKPDVPEDEGECSYLKSVSLTKGDLILTLSGTQVGTYTFAEANGGWTIQTADGTYVALVSNALGYSADAFVWTYSSNRFSTSVTSTSSSSSSNWWSSIFGGLFGSGSSTTTTTYYLVSSGSGVAVSTSNTNATAAFYVQATGEHVYGNAVANNGAHEYTCTNCGNKKSVPCTDENCQLCHPAAKVNVSVNVTSSSSGNNWFSSIFGGLWGSSSSKTYTATISVSAEGTDVSKVEYSTNGGSSWTQGTSFTSSSNITAFDIRVTCTNGVTYLFNYNNGTVTEIG